MASGNLQFRVEHGMYVQGSANVSGGLRVGGDLSVTGNIVSSGTSAGDFIPQTNSYSLGNTTNRWSLFAVSGDFNANVGIAGTLTANNLTSSNVVPTANGDALGSATRRWNITANGGGFINVATTDLYANVANVASILYAAALTSNTTQVTVSNAVLSVNTGSKLAIYATGNSTYSNLSLNNDVTNVAGNVAFDTDLLFLDAVNNRVGFKNTTPSNSAVVTVTGNVEFSVANSGIRLQTSNATHNASILVVANTTNSRFTFSTYDNSNSSVQDGGFVFTGVINSTSSQTLLAFNNAQFQYKSSNVFHSGNFGIYNVSGTRLGP